MVTDDERREVAANLREDAKRYILEGRFCASEMPYRLAKAIGLRFFGAGPQISELFPRIADLIEPQTQCPHYHSDRHYCSVHGDVVDRNTLLELTSVMRRDAREHLSSASLTLLYAAKILSALGVDDG